MLTLINLYLGYGREKSALTAADIEGLEDTVGQILAELAEVDEKLKAARADSMATEVGDLKVDYAQHVDHLRGEGSRLLENLSALVEIPVRFNKYTGAYPTQARPQRNVYNVVSYW